jgi:N-acetylmuramoyl-L-alanine amidase
VIARRISRATSLAASLAAIALAASTATARTVLVDIGHNLAAPGSIGASGTTEFSHNRELGIQVAAEMRRLGWTVVTPNLDGHVRALGARPASATAARADLFLAIHHDSVQSWQMPQRDRFSGFSVWASGSHPAAAASKACATAIGRSMRSGGMRPNLSHGDRVQGEGRDLQDASIGRYRRDDLAVLRLSKTPAVLVEAGVIVNPAEEAWLSRQDVISGIARAIAQGADRCIR